jgi:hypothetical protein
MIKQSILSDDQKEIIYQINVEANQKNDVLKTSRMRMNEAAQKRSFHCNNEIRKAKIKDILTPEQIKIMKQKMTESKEIL